MPVNIHGKEYYTVVERLKMLKNDFKIDYSLTTDLLKCDDKVVVMKATLKIGDNVYTGITTFNNDVTEITSLCKNVYNIYITEPQLALKNNLDRLKFKEILLDVDEQIVLNTLFSNTKPTKKQLEKIQTLLEDEDIITLLNILNQRDVDSRVHDVSSPIISNKTSRTYCTNAWRDIDASGSRPRGEVWCLIRNNPTPSTEFNGGTIL